MPSALIAWNAFTLLVMLWDKIVAKSRNGRSQGLRRIPEATLLGLAVCMGAAGILAGMYLFRHKTRHRIFTIGVPLAFLLNAVILRAMGIPIG